MPAFVYTDGVPACSLMVRREVTERIGFLPEENFLYWDDTEWCLLCNRAGMKVAAVGSSKAYHAMGAKKEDVNTFPTYYAWRNWISFFMKYTPTEKLADMAMQFLSSVYEIQFIGWYNDVYNKANTVMAAYDDALHGVTGKAGEGRIFPVDLPGQHFRELFASAGEICMVTNGYMELAARIRTLAKEYGGSDIRFSEAASAEDISLAAGRDRKAVILYLCQGFLHENVERLGSLAGQDVRYWDVDDCIVPAAEQPDLQKSFIRGRELFIFSQLPLFLRQTEGLRAKVAAKETRK